MQAMAVKRRDLEAKLTLSENARRTVNSYFEFVNYVPCRTAYLWSTSKRSSWSCEKPCDPKDSASFAPLAFRQCSASLSISSGQHCSSSEEMGKKTWWTETDLTKNSRESPPAHLGLATTKRFAQNRSSYSACSWKRLRRRQAQDDDDYDAYHW